MRDSESVAVSLGARSYDILIGHGLLERAAELLKPFLARPFAVIVSDENVAPYQFDRVRMSLEAANISARAIILPPGEETKNYAMLERLCGELLNCAVTRTDIVCALGGGVIGDLTGLAVSLVKRGLRLVHMPTSLLAQVDAAIGGKTAINTPHGKNLIGTFHQPALVIADLSALATLPERHLRAGYAEIVKYGLICDSGFFEWLEKNGKGVLAADDAARSQAVSTACRHKAAIVAADEREEGTRAVLNLGHTFGHALEAAAGFNDDLLHGEAVAVGLVLAFDLSESLGLCPPGRAARIAGHFRLIGLPAALSDLPGAPFAPDRLLALMTQDKKRRGDTLTLVLARDIGEAILKDDVPLTAIQGILQADEKAKTRKGVRP